MKTTMLVMLGALTMSASAEAQIHRTHVFFLSAEQVQHVVEVRLAEQGVMTNEARIEMLSRVVTSSERPDLHVTSILALDSVRPTRRDMAAGMTPRFAVRLACTTAKVCLPFYAIVSLPATTESVALQPPQTLRLRESAHPLAQPIVVKAGSRATMLMSRGDAHIQMTVTCMDDGVEGQTIRVSNPLDHSTLQAQVLRDGLVKGAF